MGRGIIEIFGEIPDPRKGNALRHKLDEILTIAILATLSECSQFTQMELFGVEREEWLRTFLELPAGIPSHDTFGDVFAALDPEAIRSCFMEWVETIRERISGEIVAIDGKSIRRSKDMAKNKRAVHIVSAWAASNQLVIGELATEEKSNEITAIPELLKLLKLKGCVVTIDAMGTQREIAQTIVDAEADYVLPVKENQPTLLEDISLYFETEKQCIMKNGMYAKTVEKSHGRYETRTCYTTTQIDWLEQRVQWKGLSGIAMVESTRQLSGSDVVEKAVHYLIYSKSDMTPPQLLEAKRAHWGVENQLHWVPDMNFREDEARAREGNCAENMSILRRMALSLIRNEKSSKASLNLKRKKCMLSVDYLMKVIGVS